jgi:murein DD-endopeptidase MepM/ murein hydrolase activator NlpD
VTAGTVSGSTSPSAATAPAAPSTRVALPPDLSNTVLGFAHAAGTVRRPSVVQPMRVQRVVRVSRDAPRVPPREQREEPEAAGWQLPLASGSYRASSQFGECSALWSQCHTGLDLAAPSGTPILSVASGVVTETAYAGAYGNRTIVTLEDGTELWYCHQDSVSVGAGEAVAAGQPIGTVGTTGNTTGAHLHLEVRPGGGDPVDPLGVLAAHGVTP